MIGMTRNDVKKYAAVEETSNGIKSHIIVADEEVKYKTNKHRYIYL